MPLRRTKQICADIRMNGARSAANKHIIYSVLVCALLCSANGHLSIKSEARREPRAATKRYRVSLAVAAEAGPEA